MIRAFETFAENQMLLDKLVAFMYTIVGVKRSASEGKTKEATTGGYAVSSLLQPQGKLTGDGGESSLESEICCVCLSSMEEGEEKRVLPCMHEFHRGCVDKWVSSCRKNCPICRFSMGEEERFQFHRREAFTEEMLIWFSSFHIAGF